MNPKYALLSDAHLNGRMQHNGPFATSEREERSTEKNVRSATFRITEDDDGGRNPIEQPRK